ncbi:helix-turn-helix domain-containing protein [Nocardia sp. NPDC046473]|uniref:helix-turn-helix domain-containing protein n=1 Tax=Nocardia sp. NPDC046473 TaxID=3155733 RepID=UPI0033C8C89D
MGSTAVASDFSGPVGTELRVARARRRLTRPQPAAPTGCGVRTIQRIETGVCSPEPQQRRALCAALGVAVRKVGRGMRGWVGSVRGTVRTREEVRPMKAVSRWVLPIRCTVGD